MSFPLLPLATFAALIAITGPASAHVSLQTPAAAAGGSYEAILQVPHGCEGAATTAIRIRVPEGLFNVKPMPKPGWTIEVVKGPYAKAYQLHGSTLTEGVTEIIWSGGELPDDFYDEFAFRGTLSGDLDVGTVLNLPTLQSCGAAEEAWIDVSGEADAQKTAPRLTIAPAEHDH